MDGVRLGKKTFSKAKGMREGVKNSRSGDRVAPHFKCKKKKKRISKKTKQNNPPSQTNKNRNIKEETSLTVISGNTFKKLRPSGIRGVPLIDSQA